MKSSGNENVPCFTSFVKWLLNMYGTFHFFYALPLLMTTFQIGVWIFPLKKLTKFGPFRTNVSKVQTKNKFFRFHFSKGFRTKFEFRILVSFGGGDSG